MEVPAGSVGRAAGMRQMLLALAFAAAFAPTACFPAASPFRTNDITDAGFANRGFDLTDHRGRRRMPRFHWQLPASSVQYHGK